MSRPQLLERLKSIVRGSVVNSNGDRYKNYSGIVGDYIWFGNQGICISDFVHLILIKGGSDDPSFRLIN